MKIIICNRSVNNFLSKPHTKDYQWWRYYLINDSHNSDGLYIPIKNNKEIRGRGKAEMSLSVFNKFASLASQ